MHLIPREVRRVSVDSRSVDRANKTIVRRATHLARWIRGTATTRPRYPTQSWRGNSERYLLEISIRVATDSQQALLSSVLLEVRRLLYEKTERH